MTTTTPEAAAERMAKAAERSEHRSLEMLRQLRQRASEWAGLDDLLDLDRSRLARVVDGDEEATDPGRVGP